MFIAIGQGVELALLNLVQQHPDCGHDLLELVLGELAADEQWDYARKYFRPDLVWAERIT